MTQFTRVTLGALNSKAQTPVRVGEKVHIQNPQTKTWDSEGILSEARGDGKSFTVKLPHGKELLRNKRFLKPKEFTLKTSNKFSPLTETCAQVQMSTHSQENQVSASVQELQGPADQDQVQSLIPEETEVWYITAGEKVRRQFQNHIRQRIGELKKEKKGEERKASVNIEFSTAKATTKEAFAAVGMVRNNIIHVL